MAANSVILISGTPGTGKTSVARFLHQNYGHTVISLTEVVKSYKLYSEFDEPRDTYVIDPEKMDEFLVERIDAFFSKPPTGEILIIEGHYADMVESDRVTAAFILRCHPVVLESRLSKRDYSKAKIRENIQAELLGNCTSYMLEHPILKYGGKIFEIRSDEADVSQIANTILQIISGTDENEQYQAGILSWLSDPSVPLTKYLD